MSEKLILARLKKFGKTFELSVDPEKALAFKKGQLSEAAEALQAERVFTDARKGLAASAAELQQAFKTIDVLEVAAVILREGEIQGTGEQRTQEREQRQKKLITLIRTIALDARTNLPIPPQRIEAAVEQAKIHLNDQGTVEDQLDEVIQKLRPLLPLKIEQKQLIITIPAVYAGKLYQPVVSKGKMIREDWKSDGSWQVTLEVPGGLVQDIIGQLNAWTHGEVQVTVK